MRQVAAARRYARARPEMLTSRAGRPAARGSPGSTPTLPGGGCPHHPGCCLTRSQALVASRHPCRAPGWAPACSVQALWALSCDLGSAERPHLAVILGDPVVHTFYSGHLRGADRQVNQGPDRGSAHSGRGLGRPWGQHALPSREVPRGQRQADGGGEQHCRGRADWGALHPLQARLSGSRGREAHCL